MMTVFTCDGTEGVVSSGYRSDKFSSLSTMFVDKCLRRPAEQEDPRPRNAGTTLEKYHRMPRRTQHGCPPELVADPDTLGHKISTSAPPEIGQQQLRWVGLNLTAGGLRFVERKK